MPNNNSINDYTRTSTFVPPLRIISMKKILKLYSRVSFFIYYLFTALTWLYFVLPFSIPFLLFMSGIIIEYKINGYRKNINKYILTAFFSLSLLCVWDWFIENWLNGFFTLVPTFFILFLTNNSLKNILATITKWYSYLMIVSIALYTLSFFIQLPNIGLLSPPNYPDYYNSICYLQNTNLNLTFFRFNGPFVEPGHLSMASFFILMANGLNFSKRLTPIYISIILSFSLAGYVLLVLAIIILKIRNIKALFLSIIIFASIGVFIQQMTEDNPFTKLIIERLEYDDEKGVQGNNRFHGSTDIIFSKSLESGKLITGLGEETFKSLLSKGIIDGAGFKIYLLEKGGIGFALLLLFYISLALNSANHKYSFVYLFLILCAFLQRAYMGSYAWTYPFISCVFTIHSNSIKVFGKKVKANSFVNKISF